MRQFAPFIEEAYSASRGEVEDILARLLEWACPVAAAADDSRYHFNQGILISISLQTNVLTTTKDCYKLNVAARLFLTEDSIVMDDDADASTYDVVQKRFISHYREPLTRLKDDEINR